MCVWRVNVCMCESVFLCASVCFQTSSPRTRCFLVTDFFFFIECSLPQLFPHFFNYQKTLNKAVWQYG